MSRVSVIIPTYNRRDYVQEAIDSVLAQTYTDYEIIVIDDGSTDDTGDVLPVRYGDRIHYEWQENQGESVARNRGIELAQGEYIAFLDSDDLWLPEKLAKQVVFLETHPDAGSVICQGIVIDESGCPKPDHLPLGANLRPEDLALDALLCIGTIPAPSSMLLVRHDIVSQSGGFDPAICYGEDWDFSIRLRFRAPIAKIDEPLCYIRYHLNSQWRLKTWDKIEPTLKDRLRTIEKGFALVDATVPRYRDLRQRVVAREYTDAAMAALAWGEYATARDWLGYVIHAVEQSWISSASLGGQFVQFLADVQSRAGRYSARTLRLNLSRTLKTLATAGFSYRNRRRFAGEVWAAWFFESVREDNRHALRWLLPHLLLAAPKWALNRGVWSRALDAYLGGGKAHRIRALWKDRQNRDTRARDTES